MSRVPGDTPAVQMAGGSGMTRRRHPYPLPDDVRRRVLRQAAAWRDAGGKVAIATVVDTWGSSPRPVGSQLVVNDKSQFVGSVSGGCIEGVGGRGSDQGDGDRQSPRCSNSASATRRPGRSGWPAAARSRSSSSGSSNEICPSRRAARGAEDETADRARHRDRGRRAGRGRRRGSHAAISRSARRSLA